MFSGPSIFAHFFVQQGKVNLKVCIEGRRGEGHFIVAKGAVVVAFLLEQVDRAPEQQNKNDG